MKYKMFDKEIDEKGFKRVCMLMVLIIILFCSALYFEIGTLRNYNYSDDVIMDKNNEIEYHIDKVVAGRKYIEIVGWAYKKNQNIGYYNNRFIIQNQNTKEYKAFRTKMTNIDELFSIDGKYDCRRAGMYAKSIAIDLKHGYYKIFIEYKNDNENILVDTKETFKY